MFVRKQIGPLSSLAWFVLGLEYLGGMYLVFLVLLEGVNQEENLGCLSALRANLRHNLFLLVSRDSRFKVSKASEYEL